ncbi:MAG: glucose-6-phosphate dehydrogenase [Gammaproteobacteria bacterium]|nr:glucose-6-phosphate dehydrogenase [Gammaproteobacteria bacterium]MBU2408947.1 glucose-6-phosphate dehydrogenase [Gammaproteobacteria bacterium]
MTGTPPAPQATLVIFGITGDLSHRLLMPSLINMTASGLVDDQLSIIGIGRTEGDDEWLRSGFDPDEAKTSTPATAWESLRGRISYLRGDLKQPATYERLASMLEERGDGNVAFYFATAPEFFDDIIHQLANAGLLREHEGAFRRVAIEKPFGHDFESARELNRKILSLVDEKQVYRVDHFLGKETVQNIMVTRFANTMVESVWNSKYIEHVQITVAETVDVGGRGSFYDAAGALRDMVPNHLFQLLAMICMEPPNSFDAEAVRNEKAKVFRAIRGPRPEDVGRDAVRGRYSAGRIGDRKVGDYRAAKDVAPDSRTETYAALKLTVDSWRWAGVPFYLRTGKALSHRDSEVVLTFRPVPFAQFRGIDVSRLPPNKLVIQIQPDEGMTLDLIGKRPGPELEPAPVQMNFSHANAFGPSRTTGYETLLYDLLHGDQTLFQRADEIEAAWLALQPVIEAWQSGGEPEAYVAGSAGPKCAEELIERDGRQWHAIGP